MKWLQTTEVEIVFDENIFVETIIFLCRAMLNKENFIYLEKDRHLLSLQESSCIVTKVKLTNQTPAARTNIRSLVESDCSSIVISLSEPIAKPLP